MHFCEPSKDRVNRLQTFVTIPHPLSQACCAKVADRADDRNLHQTCYNWNVRVHVCVCACVRVHPCGTLECVCACARTLRAGQEGSEAMAMTASKRQSVPTASPPAAPLIPSTLPCLCPSSTPTHPHPLTPQHPKKTQGLWRCSLLRRPIRPLPVDSREDRSSRGDGLP